MSVCKGVMSKSQKNIFEPELETETNVHSFRNEKQVFQILWSKSLKSIKRFGVEMTL